MLDKWQLSQERDSEEGWTRPELFRLLLCRSRHSSLPMKGNEKTAKCRHLHPDTIVVVHAPQHLPKIIRVDLIWDPREVLDTVCWSPGIWFYRIWLRIFWPIIQQDKNIARMVHLLTCSWQHRESAWSRCCLFWLMWSNRRWMSSLSCLSHCSQTRHTLGRRRQVFLGI